MQPTKPGRLKPYLTMKGAVKYLASGDARERENILREYKYPESGGPNDYYHWSHDAIRAFHAAPNDVDILRNHALDMEKRMRGATPQAISKLDNNRRVLESYQAYFINRVLTPLEHNPQLVDCEGVSLNLRPDLVALEGKATRVIQFVLSERPASDAHVRNLDIHVGYTKQFLLFYAQHAGIEVKGSDCQVFVIATGDVYKASGVTKTFEAKLKSAMREARRTWGEI